MLGPPSGDRSVPLRSGAWEQGPSPAAAAV